MSEREKVGVVREIECDRPVPVCSDRFRNILRSELKLDFTNGLGTLVIGGGGVEAGEYIVEVDRFTLDEVKPF